MNFPSELHSTALSHNDVKSKLDVGSASISNKFLSTQPPEDPPTYNTHRTQGFVDRNPTTLTGLHDLLGQPYLMATICTSSPPAHVHSENGRIGAVSSARRNAKTIERQRRREMKALFSALRSLLPDENLRVFFSLMMSSVFSIRHQQYSLLFMFYGKLDLILCRANVQ